jgi:hypothetical protein
MNIEVLLNRLNKPRQTAPGKWLSCCPAHDDKSPSLAIKLTEDNKILLHCFAGCGVTEVVNSIGLSLSDLMPESTPDYGRTRKKAPRFNKSELFDLLVFEALLIAAGFQGLLLGKILTDDDLTRLSRAQELILALVCEVQK